MEKVKGRSFKGDGTAFCVEVHPIPPTAEYWFGQLMDTEPPELESGVGRLRRVDYYVSE